jgi:transposase InsO family protein
MSKLQAGYPKEKRILWYQSVDRDRRSVLETCKIFGISRKCYYKWRSRDFLGGGDSVHSRIQKSTKLTWEVKRFIIQEKKRLNYGPEKMRLLVKKELGLSVSTTVIYRLYVRQRLIRRPQKKSVWYAPLKYRLVITKPGEGVQMDVKYVYPQGRRKYQFSVLDPYTGKYFFLVFERRFSIHAVTTLKRAERYFRFSILSVQTDNGSEFRGEFHGWCQKTKRDHFFIPKKSPWWNGKVERVHRSMDDEYYQNPLRVWKSPEAWLHFYNFERLHLGLKGLTPHEKWLESVTLDC